MDNLFDQDLDQLKPLAYRLRPKSLSDFVGQEDLLGKGCVLNNMLLKGKLSNMLLYGPSGCGKSSLGELISKSLDYKFFKLDATTTSLNELKAVVVKAKEFTQNSQKACVLFLDEIHRFNKLQQDALLSYCENGTLILIGATTQNPYYCLNNALLSRLVIFEFKPLNDQNIGLLIDKACESLKLLMSDEIKKIIIHISKGDARIAINYTQLYKDSWGLDEELLKEQFKKRAAGYDNKNDKYTIISAFIKSMRGSDVDSALYWLGRMLKAGEDPRYIARRMMVFASEDIGLANSNALLLANAALTATNEIGMPEVRIILSHVCIYLTSSLKSNSAISAISTVYKACDEEEQTPVPKQLLPNSKEYLYPHSHENNFILQEYGKTHAGFYRPGDNPSEERIKKRLLSLWGKNPTPF